MISNESAPVERRTILAALAALPLTPALVTAAAAAPITAVATDRTAWEAAILRLRAAEQATEAAARERDRAAAVFDRIEPSDASIHWREFWFGSRESIAHGLDLDRAWSDFVASEGTLWWSASPATTKARIHAALESVADFRARYQEAYRTSGLDEADRAESAAGEEHWNAREAAFLTPAPDWTAVQWKIERLFGASASKDDRLVAEHCPELVEALMADVRRLRGGGEA